jgi:hypothetical protein
MSWSSCGGSYTRAERRSHDGLRRDATTFGVRLYHVCVALRSADFFRQKLPEGKAWADVIRYDTSSEDP